MSQIKAPKPVLPNATRRILENDFDEDELSSRFAATGIYDDYYYDDEDVITDFGAPGSPASSVGSSLSYHSDSSGSSGYSTPSSDCSSCTCERYGITRKGERVRLDCGGSRCSYEDSCSSSEDETEYIERSSRRNGIVVRQ
jgi:hypothetical protein